MAGNDVHVHFFDIASALPGSSKSWSPNTLKVRMVLNYKGIPYTQSFISYPDIAPLLRQFELAQNPTGIPYTLPTIIHKPSVKSNPHGALMDSFAITAHLDCLAPSPSLFPSGDASYALALAMSKLLSAALKLCSVLLIPVIPEILDQKGREYFIKTRSAWYGQPLSQVRPKEKAEVRAILDATKNQLANIAQMLRGRLGKKGPFLEGERPSYADFMIVAFLAWWERGDKEVWQEFLTVGDGEFKALWDACLPWLEGQGEEKEWPVPQ